MKRIVTFCSLLALSAACDEVDTLPAEFVTLPDTAPDAGTDSGETDVSGDAVDEDAQPAPTLPELEDGWTVFEPGGDTSCSRGTPYRFAVRKGTTNRVLFDFMGGGACWDEFTCSLAGSIFNEDVEGLEDMVNADFDGIYDADNPDNPFADWYHVFIPYCTGDIHWGDATTTYGSGTNEVTIEHRGAVNTRAVMDWVTDNFSAPESLFVTGCSAGAYGSVGWTPRIIDAYPDTPIAQLGDSGVGVITDNFFEDSFPSWNALELLPDWIATLDPAQVDIFALNLSDLYLRVAAHYENVVFSQYSTAFDDNQTFYFQAMGGGDQFAWSTKMYERISQAQAAPNFASFIAPGEQHCILPYENFYTVEAGGTTLVEFINELIDGGNPGNVECEECEAPE